MFRYFAHLYRLGRACVVLARYGALNEAANYSLTPLWIKFFLRPWIFVCGGYSERAKSFSLADGIQKTGPAYIKIGQFFASRSDLLPPAICRELGKLQDKVPPFSQKKALAALRSAFGEQACTVFKDFSQPVAAASVAQVHFAILPGGEKVAVKILRPNVRQAFERDLSAFAFGVKILHFFVKRLRRLKLPTVVRTLESWVENELDLRMEAAAASEFKDLAANDRHIYIPKVYWDYSCETILTYERIEGIPLTDRAALAASSHDLPKIGRELLRFFLYHATREGVFHGDMHQGNIIIRPDGKAALLDFGVTGRLDKDSRRFLAEILYGFVARDYERIARVHFEAGYVQKDQDLYRFSQALRAIGEPIFGRSAADISMGAVLGGLFTVTEKFKMETRSELLLLQKTMLTVEGVARSLDPNADIWKVAAPVMEDWVREKLSLKQKAIDIVEDALHYFKNKFSEKK